MGFVEHKRAHPGDDVISRLCATDGVADEEAARLSMGLLFAGHETTVVQIGLGTLLLLADRDQWRALLESPALIPNAVEEMLRAASTGVAWAAFPAMRAPTRDRWRCNSVRRPPMVTKRSYCGGLK